MTLFLDTSAPGQSAITASQQVYEFGAEVDFYLAVASNLISGQTTGPSAQFTIYSRKAGPDTEQVDYGTTNTTYARKRTGYLINVTIPAGTVNLRVVVSSDPNPLTVQTVAAATISGTSDINIKQVAGNATPGESGGLPVGVGGQIYDARMLLDASGVNLGKVYSTGQVSHSQDAVTSQGGAAAVTVQKTISGTTYGAPTTVYTVGAGKRAKLCRGNYACTHNGTFFLGIYNAPTSNSIIIENIIGTTNAGATVVSGTFYVFGPSAQCDYVIGTDDWMVPGDILAGAVFGGATGNVTIDILEEPL